MEFTADELAALGRAMGRPSLVLSTSGNAVWHDAGWNTEQRMPIAHFAADVLTWLVKEGKKPVIYASTGVAAEYAVCALDNMRVAADTWPLAVLKAAIAYQLAKESR